MTKSSVRNQHNKSSFCFVEWTYQIDWYLCIFAYVFIQVFDFFFDHMIVVLFSIWNFKQFSWTTFQNTLKCISQCRRKNSNQFRFWPITIPYPFTREINWNLKRFAKHFEWQRLSFRISGIIEVQFVYSLLFFLLLRQSTFHVNRIENSPKYDTTVGATKNKQSIILYAYEPYGECAMCNNSVWGCRWKKKNTEFTLI